jgi:peptide/nickel transport system substrate-binding protein
LKPEASGTSSSTLRNFGHLAACLLAVATLALAGCAASADSHRDPNTLVELTRTDGATLNPMYAETVEDAAVYCQLVFDSLSYIGTDYLPHPRLATDWSHSADGLHWTVNLRHDVRWSDGVPFTSKDVVFSYRTFLDPKTGYLDIGSIKYITRVTADGPYRVRFDLQYPSAVFLLNALGEYIVPEHVLGKIAPDRQRFSTFGEHPIGTGPYVLKSWQHDSETVFVRNPYGWRNPKIERIDVRTIFNDQSEMEALINGSADLIDDLSSNQYRQIQRLAPHIKLMTFPSLYIDDLELNLDRPGLNDVAVRQAMMYGYDRVDVVHGIYADKVAVSDSLIVPALTHWYDPHIQKYPFDPAKARAVLEAAGWKLGPDGVRRKGGTKLSFELLLNQGSALLTDEMLTFIQDMHDIGIDVRLRLLDFASLVSRSFAGNYDITANGRGGAVDPDLTTLLASSQIPPNGSNTTRYRDPIVDRDLRLGLTTIDDAKRRQYYDEMQVELAKTLPILPQFGRFSAMAYSPRLHLDPKTTLQSPFLYFNVEDWTLSP